jgi:hypothetical protein
MQAYSDPRRESDPHALPDECSCDVGPGKFEGEPAMTFLCFQRALDGCADESPADGVDFYRLKAEDRPLFPAEYQDAAREYGYCDRCIAETCASTAYGYATEETEQGFVNGAEYATKDEYDNALTAIADDVEADAQADALEDK